MGVDVRISVTGVSYQVDPNLAGQEVILWWGMFDSKLYVEFDDQRFGPLSTGGWHHLSCRPFYPPNRRSDE